MEYIKIVCTGEGGSGKTTSLFTYTDKYPDTEYNPMVFDNYSITVTVNQDGEDRVISLGLFVQMHRSESHRLRHLSYPQTNVFLLFYSVMSRDRGFKAVEEIHLPEIRQHCPNVPIILVASMVDLREKGEWDDDADDWLKQQKCVPVSRKEGKDIVKKYGLFGYAEISSKTDPSSVKALFDMAINASITDPAKKKAKRKVGMWAAVKALVGLSR